MNTGWDKYGDDLKRGPRSATKVVALVGLAVMLLVIGGLVIGTCGQTASVVSAEFGPKVMLAKYEWFKDASAQLDKKLADLSVYEARFTSLIGAYEGAPRSSWSREDREQFNLWASEMAGVSASYNGLAAEYNAQMAKFNWRFANAGSLPQGAAQPLPREYKPYATR